MRWEPWAALAWMAGILAGGAWADAWGRMHHPYRGHRIVALAAPLDGFTQASAAYSFRKLRSAYTGPGIKLRRTTGGTQDIGFLGFTGFTGAPIDTAAANAFCAATTCFLDTWYDQSGNARHAPQLAAANQPAYIAGCNGTLPCARVTTGTQKIESVSVAPVLPTSISAVANRSVGTGVCYWPWHNNSMLTGGANTWAIQGGGGGAIAVTAADAAWHAAVGVVNGASSVLNLDGVETTGTVTGSTGAATIGFEGPAGTTCNAVEIIVWDNYGLTAPERAALQANQKSFFVP